MKFLISTQPDDVHSIIVKLALEEIGHTVRFLFQADLPTKQTNSVYFESGVDGQWSHSDELDSSLENEYDVVWWRRTPKPYVPKMGIHHDDYQFVLNENLCFMDGLTNNMAPNVWWVNTKEAANKADSKLYQLKIANQCDMKIPMTLYSNTPKDIRAFVSEHGKQGVIYKPFCSNFWIEESKTRVSYTAQLSTDKLGTDQLLQLSPGIYQQQIAKKYEIRVVCFGDYLISIKLNSQLHLEGCLDWRAIHPSKLLIEKCTLPVKLKSSIRLFMRKIGIVFGSFDFIVTPDDDYVFLEVNEQGQFLWIEELNPDIHLLDMFVNFLVCKSRLFSWLPQRSLHTIKQYQNRTQIVRQLNKSAHIQPNDQPLYN